MNILHVLSQFEVTGAEAYAVTLANLQVAGGDSVFMVSDTLTLAHQAKYICYPIGNRRLIQRYINILHLRNLIRDHKIDIVHAHSRAASWIAYFAVQGLKPSLISTIHGRQVVKKKNKFLNVYGEKIITVCDTLREHLTTQAHLPSNKIQVIENPIDFDSLPKRETQPRDHFKLTLAGRTTGPKGERTAELVTSVFRPLLREFRDLKIEITGGDPKHLPEGAWQKITEVSEELGGRLEISGFTRDLKQKLASSDVVIASGRIAMESIGIGIPTFAIGEATGHGLVTTRNWDECRASNFGDVALDTRFGKIDYDNLKFQIEKIVKQDIQLSDVDQLNKSVRARYGQTEIEKKVRSLYQRAITAKKLGKNWIPALMYHRVPSEPIDTQNRTFITRDNMKKHFEFFKSRGFTPIHFADYDKWTRGEGELPKKPIFLTFDDAYSDNYENLYPLLKEYGFKAIIYLLGDRTIKSNVWDQASGEPVCRLMDLEQIGELNRSPLIEWGSHSMTHAKLTESKLGERQFEIQASKNVLEDFLGTKILSFAYPYGSVNAALKKEVELAGYAYGIATDSGGMNIEDDRMQIFRANIFPEDGAIQLMKKTSSRYRRYYRWKRKQ
ncbi:MAG: polysaccharide deacetylase family protein [Xanthomonadaceae bacterium]|nr:polysaccharide deacetylase family protein [Xanthomonadaceae bacterium]